MYVLCVLKLEKWNVYFKCDLKNIDFLEKSTFRQFFKYLLLNQTFLSASDLIRKVHRKQF